MALFKTDPLSPKQTEVTQHPWARRIKDILSPEIKHAHNSIKNPKYPVKAEKQPATNRVKFAVYGDRVTKEFTYCTNLVKGLHKYRWKNFDVPIIRGYSTTQWPAVWQDLKLRFAGIAYCLQSSVAVIFNGDLIGGEKELKELVESKFIYHMCLDYYNEGVAEFARFVRSTNRPFAYMHISINDNHIGTLIFMLYADVVPYTCENFLRLCKETKGGYGGTPVHRIVKDGWIQCGGFGLKNTPLNCENFIIPFDQRGVLAMANDGRDVDCSTQFFVLLQPAPWMARKYVAFGQLIEGEGTLKKLESVTTWYESPTSKVIIYRSGLLNMECHDIFINKGANEYIDGHIEDLNEFTELLWEHILVKVFLEVELREIERLREQDGEVEGEAEPVEPTTQTEKAADDNQDFDVEEYEDAEAEEDGYQHQSLQSSSLVVRPQKPFYIPLTDVPYPGDVDSDFNLMSFLKGDYCLECDMDLKKIKPQQVRFNEEDIWSPSSSSQSEMSLNSDEKREITNYIKENADTASYAGVAVGGIAKNLTKYYDKSGFISDEHLRRLSLAYEDRKFREDHNVKVSICTRESSRQKQIKRRQTGYIQPELNKLKKPGKYDYDDDDDEDDDEDDEASSKKAVQIVNDYADSQPTPPRPSRKVTGMVRRDDISFKPDDDDDDDVADNENNRTNWHASAKPKESVLVRLYDEVKVDHDIGPTLKDYKPTAEMHKNFFLLTRQAPLLSGSYSEEESREKYKRFSMIQDSLDNMLNTQHGKKINTKISSDYVKAMDKMIQDEHHSIRTVEYAKSRPTMTVSDYQIMNLKYQEQLKKKAMKPA